MTQSVKTYLRFIAILTTFFFTFSMVGMSALAAVTINNVKTKTTLTADIGELPNKLPKTKMELTSKRTEYSTRYLNPDGSFTEKVFDNATFYHDSSDKKWKNIDNTLINSTNAGVYENTANDLKTYFSSETGNKDLVSIDKNGMNVSFTPMNGNISKGNVKDNTISYPNLFDKADAKYEVKGNSLKESLILSNLPNTNTFTFEVKLKGLKSSVDKDGNIYFTDKKNNKAFYLVKPYMTDANGKYSDNVKLTLRDANGKTFVDVEPDKAFLSDSSTKYPVTIDPTISTWDILRDTFVSSSFPTSSYASNNFMLAGKDTTYGTTRSLVKFYLPALPSSASITNAHTSLYQTKTDGTNQSIDLYRNTFNFLDNVTWNTMPTASTTAESTVTNNMGNAYWNWDTTQLVKDWYSGAQGNYGFTLKQQNEGTTASRSFNTVESSNNTPSLIINYTVDPIGSEDFWSFTKDGVNPANGNLLLQGTDVSIPGKGVATTIARSYNSRNSNIAGIFGYGWTSNVESKIIDAGSGPITLVDGDGTRNVFGQQIGGGYTTEGGIYLTLVKNGDGTYTITQTDGTRINYSTTGKLSSIIDTNGNTENFTYDGNGKLTTIKDASNRTTSISYGTNGYVSSITDPATKNVSYIYDTSGNLTKVTDAALNATNFAYDTGHKLTTITNARSIATTIAYDTSNRVTSITKPITISGTLTNSISTYSYDTIHLVTTVTDGAGDKIDYTYNPNGNIIQTVEDPLDSQNKAITTYSYDVNNNLSKVTDANTNNAGGNASYIYTYDSNGNLTGQQLPAGQSSSNTYDSNNNLIKATDYIGNVDNSSYDNKNNNTESTDSNTQTAATRYDSSGNILSSTQPMSVADNLIPNSSFEVDANSDNFPDNWTSAVQSGTTATFNWSTTAKIGQKSLSISNPTGWAIAYSSNIPYVVGNTYVLSGYVKTASTVGAAVLKFDYFDSSNNWIGQKYAYELQGTQDWTRVQVVAENIPPNTSYIRPAVGLNAGGGAAFFDGIQLEKGTVLSSYNLVDNSSFERVTGTNTIPDSWAKSNTLGLNDIVDKTVSYTGAGQNSFKITGESGKTKYVTQHINVSGDDTNRYMLSGWSEQTGASSGGGYYNVQVAINNTDGTIDWSNAKDFNATTTGWQHAAALVTPTKAFTSIDVFYDFSNQTGTAWFDAMRLENGNTITANNYDTNGNYIINSTDSFGKSTLYGNDTVGNQTSVTNPNGKVTNFAYDNINQLTSVTDAKSGVTAYQYDGVGNRTKVTDANNHATNYNYNEFNLVSKIINPLNQTIQLGYDKNGNTASVTTPKGDIISYTYNALNRQDGIYYNGVKKWSLAYDPNGNLTSITDSNNVTQTYSYDANNRVTQYAEDASHTIGYGYDDNSNLSSLNITAGSTSTSMGYGYNSLNELTSIARNSSSIVGYVYDERGNITSESFGNGAYTAFEYDGGNRITSLKNYRAVGQLINSYAYTYDNNGNITNVATNSGTLSYQYDELNRLTQETQADGTVIAYAYDAVGNRTSKTVTVGGTPTTTNYTYDAANELTAVNSQSYTYDLNGNLTNNGQKNYVYNEANQLIQVKDLSNNVIASFTYDSEGKRVSMTTSGGTIYYHYSGNNVVYETNSSGSITAQYTWDANGSPLTMIYGGVTYYYHTNGHGDVTALTDASGNSAATYTYDAWGNILSKTGGTIATANPYRYAGYRYDESTGLYYLMARYYDAGIGRFINRDTFHGYEDEPVSLNQYVYTNNDPISNIDSSGHFAESIISGTSSLINNYSTFVETQTKNWGPEAIPFILVGGIGYTTFPWASRQRITTVGGTTDGGAISFTTRIPGFDAIPDLKRGSTEVLKKARKNPDFKPKNNKRRPEDKKSHKPMRDHQKF